VDRRQFFEASVSCVGRPQPVQGWNDPQGDSWCNCHDGRRKGLKDGTYDPSSGGLIVLI
jgi:hypothetical protein